MTSTNRRHERVALAKNSLRGAVDIKKKKPLLVAIVFLAILLIGTVLVLSLLILQGISHNQKKQTEDMLAQQSKLANVYVKQIYLSQTSENPDEFFKRYGFEIARQIGIISSLHVTIYNMTGKIVGDSLPLETTTMKEVNDTLQYALKGRSF